MTADEMPARVLQALDSHKLYFARRSRRHSQHIICHGAAGHDDDQRVHQSWYD